MINNFINNYIKTMKLIPNKEGLIKPHPLKEQVPKDAEQKLEKLGNHMKHIDTQHKSNRKPQKDIVSKNGIKQKKHEHSIGKSYACGHVIKKHTKYN